MQFQQLALGCAEQGSRSSSALVRNGLCLTPPPRRGKGMWRAAGAWRWHDQLETMRWQHVAEKAHGNIDAGNFPSQPRNDCFVHKKPC